VIEKFIHRFLRFKYVDFCFHGHFTIVIKLAQISTPHFVESICPLQSQ